MVDIQSGSIVVDGVDLSTVPRSLVRQKCFITIAQDPYILEPASLRFNLDVSLLTSVGRYVSVLTWLLCSREITCLMRA
jgi:ABC-type multidrug transport system fused ATPase/permease subunit